MNYFRVFFFTFFITIFRAINSQTNVDFCSIDVPLTPSKKPIFERHLGSLKLKIQNAKSNKITLREGERVTGYCSTGFKPLKYRDYNINRHIYRDDNINSVQQSTMNDLYSPVFECKNGQISSNFGDISKVLIGQFVECKDLKWDVYEVQKPFDWCSSKSTSYILGADILSKKIRMAGVCFNLPNMLVESIRYTITADIDVSQNIINSNISNPVDLESASLGVKLDNLLSIVQKDTAEQAVDFDGLLQGVVYKLDFISQNRAYGDLWHEYGDFLKVPWWHNLLHGNWKRFTIALSKQAALTTYDAITGISGGIKEPQFGSCSPKETPGTLSRKFVQHNESLPAYIWTYLKGRNTSEDFVVIGYNSPFFQFFDSKEIVFCKDICGDIPWLENVRSTFSYSVLGVIFCCTPEDVRKSQMLNGFPNELNDTLPSTTTEKFDENKLARKEKNLWAQIKPTPAIYFDEDDW